MITKKQRTIIRVATGDIEACLREMPKAIRLHKWQQLYCEGYTIRQAGQWIMKAAAKRGRLKNTETEL